MESIKLTQEEFELSYREYLLPLLLQLDKDFGVNHFSNLVDENGSILLVDLVSAVASFLEAKSKSNLESFFELLYRIDLPEKITKELMLSADINWQEFSLIVCKRELYKVYLRQKFKTT